MAIESPAKKEIGLSRDIVDPKICEECRFIEMCQYRYNEGSNWSGLIRNPDGSCQKFQRQPM